MSPLVDDLPPLVRAWVDQLLSADVVTVIQAFPDGQIDITLSAAKGKVRARPRIVLGGGPQNMVEPA